MLIIAEFENGRYEPVGEASSIDEAREIIDAYEAMGGGPEEPTKFALWERGPHGQFVIIDEV